MQADDGKHEEEEEEEHSNGYERTERGQDDLSDYSQRREVAKHLEYAKHPERLQHLQ